MSRLDVCQVFKELGREGVQNGQPEQDTTTWRLLWGTFALMLRFAALRPIC